MALIGTIPAWNATSKREARQFTVHRTKLRFYQSQDSKEPYCDPRYLLAFNNQDCFGAELAESLVSSDVGSLHVEGMA